MKKVLFFLIITSIAFSCNEVKKETTSKKPEIEKPEITASYKNLEVEIEGMTCEIGCARTIQSKLSKVKGITYSKVNFESKAGQFTYDENKITKVALVNKINGIAGGDLYKVTKITDVENFKTESNQINE